SPEPDRHHRGHGRQARRDPGARARERDDQEQPGNVQGEDRRSRSRVSADQQPADGGRLLSGRSDMSQRSDEIAVHQRDARLAERAGHPAMIRSIGLCIAAVVAAGTAILGAQANTEEFARRQYESGLSFMQNGRYAEALKDFQAGLASFAGTSVAGNALPQVALDQVDVPQDTAGAQAAVERLLKDYPETDSAPMAYVVSGRIALAKGRAPGDVDSALASFERVPRLFPNDEAVPAAGFYAGDTLRIVRRTDEALERFRRVSLEYPRSISAARARIRAGP